MSRPHLGRESRIALKFAATGCLGFLTDITVLRLSLIWGLSPFIGRAISLTVAMQVTFLINGLLVFRCLKRGSWRGQWLGYMGTNGVGNLCNYLIFSGLVLSRWPVVSRHGWALVAGSVTAYAMNYVCVRLLVFGRPRRHGGSKAAVCDGGLPRREPA